MPECSQHSRLIVDIHIRRQSFFADVSDIWDVDPEKNYLLATLCPFSGYLEPEGKKSPGASKVLFFLQEPRYRVSMDSG